LSGLSAAPACLNRKLLSLISLVTVISIQIVSAASPPKFEGIKLVSESSKELPVIVRLDDLGLTIEQQPPLWG
jgi:hypothetical protein